MIAASVLIAFLALCVFLAMLIVNHRIKVEESDRDRALRITRELKGVSQAPASPSSMQHAFAHRLLSLVNEAGFTAKTSEALLALFGLCLVAFALGYLIAGVIFALACASCTPILAAVFLRIKATRRTKAFDRQFASALMVVSQSMSSGMTSEAAFASVSQYSPEPLKSELARMSAEVKFAGLPLDTAMSRLADRTGSSDVAFLATATKLQKIGGGSLTGVLKSAAQKIEARIRLRGLVDSVTSSARWTSKIVAAIPFLILGALVIGAPDIGKTFWESASWPYVVICIAALVAVGLFVMARLYKMRVE